MSDGTFKKGHTPWNKGLSKRLNTGRTHFKRGHNTWNKNKSWSSEMREKLSIARKGKTTGPNHPMWKGGIKRDTGGQLLIWSPDHPFKSKQGYVREARLIAEKHICRYLESNEVIHHIDFDNTNNNPKNIFVFENHSVHMSYHMCLRYNPILQTFPPESNIV